MTDDELRRYLESRKRAWRDLDASHESLGEMPPEMRGHIDDASRRFRDADAAIVAELNRRTGPVTLGAVTLHLMSDRDSFAILPVGGARPRDQTGTCYPAKGMLYGYGR